MATPGPSCPNCGNRLSPGDFLCVRCETIADPSEWLEDESPREPTLVRAMLSPPEPTLSRERPRPPPPPPDAGVQTDRRSITKTRLFTLPADPEDVPCVLMGLDLKDHPLSSFEAYFISLIDGRSSVEQLRQMSGLSGIETQSLLRTLIDRKLLSVAPPAPKPASRPRETPAAPLPAKASAPAAAPPAAREPKAPPARQAATRPAAPPAKEQRSPSELRAEQLRRAVPQARSAPAPAPSAGPLQRAIALERAGDVVGAIQVLEAAIAHAPDPAPLYNRLAIALVKERRDVDTAEEMLRKALELDPNNEVYRQNLFKVVSMAAAITGLHKRPTRRG